MKAWRIGCAAAAIFALHLAWNVLSGIGTWDEAFALRVVERVRGGEILYRDVFFGATPLGVHLGRAAAAWFGVEIVAIKIACAACLSASALLACRLSRQITGTHAGAPFLVALQLVLGPCDPRGLYTPLADALLLATATLALDRRFAAAGVAAGLCFAAKQNAGLFALAAALLGPLLRDGATRALPRAGALLGGFAVAVGAVLLPVAWQGAFPAFVDFAFTGKQHYLEHGGVSYAVGLAEWWRALQQLPHERDLAALFRGQAFLLPFVVLAFALVAARRAPTVFPRADLRHLASAVPALGVVGFAAWHALDQSGRRRALAWIASGWLVAGLASVWLPLMAPWVRGERGWSSEPHLRGALLPRNHASGLAELAIPLRVLAGRDVFIASPRASFLYLLSGARNPTPFDWPGLTSMGPSGEERTIERIAAGEIANACLEADAWPLAPRRLERAIEQQMNFVADLGACRLYRAR
jgi:hypothetical protein